MISTRAAVVGMDENTQVLMVGGRPASAGRKEGGKAVKLRVMVTLTLTLTKKKEKKTHY